MTLDMDTKQQRLQELIGKGKTKPLSNKELIEMISLLGPDKALEAVRCTK